MKRLFTLLIFSFFLICINAQVKIAYINGQATAYPEDSVLKVIQSVPNVSVTVLQAQSTAQKVSYYEGYDVVVLAENVPSSNVEALALKDTLKKANKPYLNFKMFMYGKGTAPNTWKAMGAAANNVLKGDTIADTIVIIPDAAKTHAIFNGITIPADGRLKVIKKVGYDGNVSVGSKGPKLRAMQSCVFSAGYTYTAGNVLARPSFYKGISSDTAWIHEIVADKYLAIGIFGGPPAATRLLPILTDEGYQIVKNAVAIMKAYVPTKISAISNSKITFIRMGEQILVNFGSKQKAIVSIYNVSGKLIDIKTVNADNTSIDFSGKSSGIYIIKIAGTKTSGTQKFVIH